MAQPSFDREIGVGGIVRFLIGLTVLSIVTAIAMYGLYKFLQARETARDRPASPLVDRSVPRMPPEPRLQTSPERELATMRAEQQALLESYGWVDESAGVARIPITAAMDLLLARGLPVRPQPADHVLPAPTATPIAPPHAGGH
jgi:hypothetical protein